MKQALIDAFGQPGKMSEGRCNWELGKFTFCVGFAEGNPVALFDIKDEKWRSCGGGSGEIPFLIEAFECLKNKVADTEFWEAFIDTILMCEFAQDWGYVEIQDLVTEEKYKHARRRI